MALKFVGKLVDNFEYTHDHKARERKRDQKNISKYTQRRKIKEACLGFLGGFSSSLQQEDWIHQLGFGQNYYL